MSLENKQQCLVSINTHIYEDKFWSYIVTNNVGQGKKVTIYGRSVSENLRNVVMREPHILHIVNFFSLTVKQKGVITRTLHVKISLIIVNKITGKLPHTFILVHLIIPFDRDREYC